jgi:hypothetical protein
MKEDLGRMDIPLDQLNENFIRQYETYLKIETMEKIIITTHF